MVKSAHHTADGWWHRHPVLPGAVAAVVLVALVFAMLLGRDLIWDLVARYKTISAMPVPVGLLVVTLCIYALLIAVPFMPGVEVGLALLMLQGASIAPAVYLATVSGLGLAFAVGYLVPQARLARLFDILHLRRAAGWLAAQKDTTPAQKLAELEARSPRRLAPWLLRSRYLWLAILVNLPGNGVLGGGGGLCLLAGLSRIFSPRAMVLTITLAVAPVPALVWIMGAEVLETVPLP